MSSLEKYQHLKVQLEAIKSATNNFSDDNYIGKGGFGRVYWGELVHSTGKTMVALKRLDDRSGQGNTEFWREIMMLSVHQHENIISLLGYCNDDGEKILVYEYATNKSLDSYLDSNDLTWVQRLKISIGVARGLAYLHEPAEAHSRIFHRDIKSANILLDHNWNPKISDFGLSKFAPANDQFTFLVSDPAGTYWYIDPVYRDTGLLTKESDVYSFGVVLFEILCGRLSFCKNIKPLVSLVHEYYQENKLSELVYSNIKDEVDKSSLKLFVDIAYQCLKGKREERPLMTEIVMTLERALDIQANRAGILNVEIKNFAKSSGWRYFDVGFLQQPVWIEEAVCRDLVLHVDGHVPLEYRYQDSDGESTLVVNNFHEQELLIHVNQRVSVDKHRHLGKARLKLTDLTPGIPMTRKLHVKDNNRHIDDLEVCVLYTPTNSNTIDYQHRSLQTAPAGTPKDGGFLVVRIQAANLDDESRNAQSYVSLLFHGDLRKTVSMMNTNKPKWVKEFTFLVQQPQMSEKLHLEVIGKSWKELISGKQSFGWVDISLASVISMKWTNELYQLRKGNKLSNNYLQVEMQWRTLSD